MGIGVVSTTELDASSMGTERLELEVPGKVQHPTKSVIQASGRLSSTTRSTKNECYTNSVVQASGKMPSTTRGTKNECNIQ